MIGLGNLFEEVQTNEKYEEFFFRIFQEFTYDVFLSFEEPPSGDISDIIPEHLLEIYIQLVFEFFMGNRYPDEDNKLVSCIDNVIDSKSFTKKDLELLYAAKNSYMDLFEVVEIVPEKSITLRSLISHTDPVIIIKEKLATRSAKKGEYLGCRILKFKTHNELSGVTLKIEKDVAIQIVHMVKKMNKEMYKNLDLFKLEDDEAELSIKRMWCKEIVAFWLKDELEKHNALTFNVDGEIIEYFQIKYPIKKNTKSTIRNILNERQELLFLQSIGREYQWIWVDKGKADRHKKIKLKKYEQIAFSSVTNESGEDIRHMAGIFLKDNSLTIIVDSKKRRDILKNYIDLYFSQYLEEPEIKRKENISAKKSSYSI